jgi:hypothetical protein
MLADVILKGIDFEVLDPPELKDTSEPSLIGSLAQAAIRDIPSRFTRRPARNLI